MHFRLGAMGILFTLVALVFGEMPAVSQGQRIPLPLHHAGKQIYQGDQFTIYLLDRGPWNDDEHCSRSGSFDLSVVFDVADDFPLDDAYLTSTLNEGLLRQLANQYCPEARFALTAHYFKDRVIGKNGRISDAATVTYEGYERAFTRMTVNFVLDAEPSMTNVLRIRGRTWNDVIAFNERGLKTLDEVEYQNRSKAQRDLAVAMDNDRRVARQDWFKAQKAATGWPGKDDWAFEVYVRGRGGVPAAPARDVADRQAQKYPHRSSILLAYVEKAHKTCGTVSPNGTRPITFSLTNKQTGLLENRDTVQVDRRLEEAYSNAKLAEGAYTVFSLNTVAGLQGDMAPMFSIWSCNGPEFQMFITGILKTK